MIEDLDEFSIPDDAIERLNDPEMLKQHVEDGKTFQELLGYSDETMEKFYSVAHKMFEGGHYKKAADAFIFLTTLNPYVHNYWVALAMCEQLVEEYEAALVAYGMAILIRGANPVTHYHSATCYEKMGDFENAVLSIEQCLQHCGDDENFADLKHYAEVAKKRLASK